MKLYRFMSCEEFEKLLSGEVLVNNTDHSEENDTDSVGFCFLPETISIKFPLEMTFEGWKMGGVLGGIVSDDILVAFETKAKLHKGYGGYAAPTFVVEAEEDIMEAMEEDEDNDEYSFFEYEDEITITEYSVTSYSLKNFKVIGFIPARHFDSDWETPDWMDASKYKREDVA